MFARDTRQDASEEAKHIESPADSKEEPASALSWRRMCQFTRSEILEDHHIALLLAWRNSRFPGWRPEAAPCFRLILACDKPAQFTQQFAESCVGRGETFVVCHAYNRLILGGYSSVSFLRCVALCYACSSAHSACTLRSR